MKTLLMALMALLSLALIASVGCESEAEHKAAMDAATKNFDKAVQGVNDRLEYDFFGTLIDTVGLDQGDSVGTLLLLDCREKGYRIHMSTGGSAYPVTGYTIEPMSTRHKAECDAIIATENRISIQRDRREKAEDKRKDDAYDKAHKVE